MFAFAPKSSLADEITEIRITHLKQLQSITLEAKLFSDKGELFESYAHYVADKDGNVDVGHDLSVGGSYCGVEPMGLIWSMKQGPGQREGIRLLKRDVTVPYDIIVNCFDGHVIPRETSLQPLSSGTFQKSYMADGVKRVPVREGRIRGTLFLPPGDGPFPGVMDLLGGTGGLVEFKASLLASRGFAALALAYFGYDDLPSSTSPYVELDYIEEAAKWLYQHPKVIPGGIALHSHCMGTWLALLLASYSTDLVKAVVAVGPWYFAISNTAYRYKGKLSNTCNLAAEAVKYTDQGIILRFCFAASKETTNPLADLPALTPVENIFCPILLVYSTEDLNVNAELTSRYIYDRLKAVNKDSLCTMLRLPGAGHMVDPPHSPLCYSSYSRFFKEQVVWGGQPKSHAMGQMIYWDKSLLFMQQHLMRNVKSSL